MPRAAVAAPATKPGGTCKGDYKPGVTFGSDTCLVFLVSSRFHSILNLNFFSASFGQGQCSGSIAKHSDKCSLVRLPRPDFPLAHVNVN